jgi:ABC-type dipeptide/oligopeptide/nickel transport system permease component
MGYSRYPTAFIGGLSSPGPWLSGGIRSVSRNLLRLGRWGLTFFGQLLAVSIVAFVVLRAVPADPVSSLLPLNATAADAAALRHELGLDLPIWRQFLIWVRSACAGDLGSSIQARAPVTHLILGALPSTIELVAAGLILGGLLGVGAALTAFHMRNTRCERVLDLIGGLTQSIPGFLWGLILMMTFGLGMHALPFVGAIDPDLVVRPVTGSLIIDSILSGNLAALASRLQHLTLPALALAFTQAPAIMRVLRSSLIDVYNEQYIEFARLRGQGEARILLRHALRNAALPTVSLIGVHAGYLFGGTLLIEGIYSLPGLGALTLAAVRTHDIPLIQGVTLTYCMVVMLLNGLVDLTNQWLNPRLRRA